MGADYFPESIWKIYTINTPLLFRVRHGSLLTSTRLQSPPVPSSPPSREPACLQGVWAIIRPWIHPITQAKVNMFSTPAAAVKQMQADGVPVESIPEFMGGGAKPQSAFELLKGEVAAQQAALQANRDTGTAADTSPDAGAATATAGATEGVAHKVATEQIGHLASV